MCRALSAFLICLSYRQRPIRLYRAPSCKGRLATRGKPAIKGPSGIAPYILAALRSFDLAAMIQISVSQTYSFFLRSG